MKNNYAKIKKLNVELKTTLNEKVKLVDYDIDSSSEPLNTSLPTSITDFYAELTHFKIDWETKDILNANGQKVEGHINILKAEEVLRDWDGVAFFKDKGDTGEILKFKIVDYFVPEACTGFLLTEDKSDAMYYFTLGDSELQPMNVSFDGYMELMFAARGFWYWQRVVLTLAGGDYTRNVEQFKTYMPQIFPDFKWEEFVALYEKVKIK